MAVMRKTPGGTLLANSYENMSGTMKGVFMGLYKGNDVAALEYNEGEGLTLFVFDDGLEKYGIKLKHYGTVGEYWATK